MLTKKQIEWLENENPSKYSDKSDNYDQMMKGRILKKLKSMQESVTLISKHWKKIAPIYMAQTKIDGKYVHVYDNVIEELYKALSEIKLKGVYNHTLQR